MTGHGSGRSSLIGGTLFTVEIHSINRRQSELMIYLPKEFTLLEPQVRDVINARIARGRLTVTVDWQRSRASMTEEKSGAALTGPYIDTQRAKAYYEAMVELQRTLGLGDALSINSVLRAPGVVLSPPSEDQLLPSLETAWPQISAALQQALSQVITLREQEGQALAKDFRLRLEELKRLTQIIRAQVPLVVENHRKLLHERLERAQIQIPIDDERLTKEIAFFADRSDITEELTRLESHIDQFYQLIQKSEPIGRTLEFLSQEMGRELNTVGAKANDLTISKQVVAAKAELEKIREQVQNIE